jgi:hypothetical protein
MNPSMLPYWDRLLRYFEDNSYVQNGLTLPFLIGSIEILEPKKEKWEINKMTQSLASVGCTVLKCDHIGEFVIGSLDDFTSQNIKNYHVIASKVVVTDSSLDHIKSIDGLTELFSKRYQSLLRTKKYSKNNGDWAYFSDAEITRIMEII